MMSIDSLGKAGGGKAQYCQSQTSQESKIEGYYQSESGEPFGIWQGKGLEAQGLVAGQKITDSDFNNIIRGKDLNGDSLMQGSGDNHRAGHDLTFSAPKSVSAAWAIADGPMRQKISDAQAKAVAAGLKMLEEKIVEARRGKGGAETEKVAGIITAQYEHCDSRELDPELHTHVLLMNLAQRQDGSFGGIESKQIYEWQHALGAVYRAELSSEIKELGFQVEADRDFFKIAGISDELCQEWSKRRTQIEAELEKRGIEPGSARSSEIASLSTREAKQEQSRDELFTRWQSEARAHGLDAQYINDLSSSLIQHEIKSEATAEAAEVEELYPDDLYHHLTQNNATFAEKDIYKIVAIRAQHKGLGLEHVLSEIQVALKNKQIINLENGKFTTREMLKLETTMIETARGLNSNRQQSISENTVKSALTEFTKTNGFSLSNEQQNAVNYITSSGQLKMVRGAAGSGKSTMAAAAKIAFQSEGYKVIGAALSGKAAAGLEVGSGIKSSTIHRLLYDIESGKQKLDNKSVLIIDEAGMVGTRMMHKLATHAEKSGAKLVLIGDERQLQAVDAGGAFKLLQKQLPEFAELKEVRRQRNDLDKEAANNIALGRGRYALTSFIERDLVHVGENSDNTKAQLVEAYLLDQNSGSEKLMLAQRRADVFQLNQVAREKNGLAGKGHIIKTANGPREFAHGDRIAITRNDSKLNIKNGEFGTLKNIEFDKSGELKFTVKIDGKDKDVSFNATAKDGFNHIDHGYAATVHKSQGATVNAAYFLATSLADKELSYVAMSRHRDTCQVFTSKSSLENQLDRASAAPTEGMIKFMNAICEQREIDINKIDVNIESFNEVREFLNENSDTEIDENVDQALRALSKAMQVSNQNENAIDYFSNVEQVKQLIEQAESIESIEPIEPATIKESEATDSQKPLTKENELIASTPKTNSQLGRGQPAPGAQVNSSQTQARVDAERYKKDSEISKAKNNFDQDEAKRLRVIQHVEHEAEELSHGI
jgi:Ti-type conjugative transfer relaxase TraA